MRNFIEDIENKIEIAKKRVGRENEEILLLVVSKTQSANKLIEVQKYGLNTFGENKVQELIEKYPLVENAKWHFIGHLQKNKVKYIIDKVDLIYSVDSLELAKEINKRAYSIGKLMPILIQINIAKEESKSGIFVEEFEAFMKDISIYENIIINGLMVIPPVNTDSLVTRNYFKVTRDLFNTMKTLDYKNFEIKYLSMGMTEDYELAIEEGSNIVRIGTGIFGKRAYKEE